MMDLFLFYIGISLFLIHEMDAIRYEEWKMLPFLSSLNDKQGYYIFITLHIPLFITLFWFLTNISTSKMIIIGIDIFMIIHLILHILFLKHKNNKFKSIFSWFIIISIAICGFLDLALFR